MFNVDQYKESARYLRQQLKGFEPEALLILGSGLGDMANQLDIFIPYQEVPYFQTSTAPGHKGRLAAGCLAGRNVLVMQGRFHIYEGYTPAEVAFPVGVAHMLGATRLIVTCACGGVNTGFNVGDLVMLSDYINFTHTSPLLGFNPFDFGFDVRFVDMSYTFDRSYQSLALQLAKEKNILLHEGVYFYMPGPQFETPAEIRAIRALGGDLVGMSTVFEVVMARRFNMRIAGFGLVTNMAAGILDVPLTEEEVIVEGQRASGRFSELLTAFVSQM